MGNDSSKLRGLVIDKNAVEANDFWTLCDAELPNDDATKELSIFQGEPIVAGQLWVAQAPMERAIKNLMIYRHPYILKYFASWEKGGQKHLTTERVLPLSLALPTQSDIQVCLGLRNILCCLIFLIEQAYARHLNIAIQSIYVNAEGAWRLGGFEYVWKAKEVNKALLDLATAYRYKSAIDPNEAKGSGECIEQYSFASLCEEILSRSSNIGNTPNVSEFRNYCATHLKHQNVAMRPKLSAVLLHPYFNHEFILIHSFLMELPLKSPQEKQDFFTGLVDRLRYFDETVVGSQVGSLLLSRMVLLDTTAQLCVTPYVLKTKTDISAALFSNQSFVKYIIPRIKQIFSVRDAQIRLILLEYFNEYVKLLTKEELQDYFLPHLLAGIKDTNDILVAKTLRCLADLVPLLGSAIVIGGNRARIFADGRPQALPDSTSHWVEPRSITPVMTFGEYMASGSPLPDNVDLSGSYNSLANERIMINGGSPAADAISDDNAGENLPRRLSPDGGEDVHNATDVEIDEDAWSDWEYDELNRLQQSQLLDNVQQHQNGQSIPDDNQQQVKSVAVLASVQSSRISSTDSFKTSSSNSATAPKIIDEISELDIKVQKTSIVGSGEDIDFFKDMEPVIMSTRPIELSIISHDTPISVQDGSGSVAILSSSPLASSINGHEQLNFTPKSVTTIEEIKVDKTRFEFKVVEESLTDSDAAGWGEEDMDDWGE